MMKTCEGCGEPFEAKSRSRRFCGGTCQKRAKRAQVIPIRRGQERQEREDGTVEAAARAELEELSAADTLLGRTVLALATRIDTGNETGAATAALSKEMRTLMVEVSAKAQRPASPVDQLRQKRLQRMGASG